MNSQKTNKVYLVGAGPGDPYLMTLRGKDLLEQADVIIYDHLVNNALLNMTSPETENIYVGKQSGRHTLSQVEINELILKKSEEGKKVVRLKGGDPFVFGRGGEEAEFLKENNIVFEIVPGITAATAALAYSGIPLTHRGIASAASIVTGHEDPDKDESDINWEALAVMNGTLVFYMGVKRLPFIIEQLKKFGKPVSTPAALIRMGTLPRQRTVTGTIENIVDKAEQGGIKPPALIVIGDVINMRDKLKWYENLPLFGKTIIVTRSHSQTKEFAGKLSILGAEVIHRPAIEIIPPEDYSELDESMQNGKVYDWIIFTSVNGVRAFAQRMKERDIDIRTFGKASFGAIGSASGKSVRKLGVKVDFIPEEFTSEGFINYFRGRYPEMKGKRVLIPSSDLARDTIPKGLSEMGAEVETVTAYRTVPPGHTAGDLKDLFTEKKIDLITFTSSSTVDNFFNQFAKDDLLSIKEKLAAGSIGPMTSDTLREHGFEPVLEAKEHTIKGLTESIIEYFSNGR